MNFVCADLGASSTRYRSNATKGETPNFLANNMVFLQAGQAVDMVPYDSSVEMALEATIEKTEGEKSIFPVHVLMGSLAERFNSTNERPSGTTHKHKQSTTYVSAVMTAALSRVKENVGEDITLYIALPPIEVKSAKDYVISQLKGKYVVKFPKYNGGTDVSLNITDVKCYEEAYMAVASYLFGLNGSLRDEAKSKGLLNGLVLSVDIGDSTTDLAIIKNGRYLEKSGQTYKVGGSTARASLCDEVRSEFGYDLPTDDANRTMCEGRLQMGSQYVDVGNIVSNSKRVLAQLIVENMNNYFRLQNTPIQTIKAAIVSGGGSLESKYTDGNGKVVVTAKPMSQFITEHLVNICPGLEVIPYGDNARIANVNGLALCAQLASLNANRQ